MTIAPWLSHMLKALKHHWPEYLIEAAGLGIFMISASVFATLLEYSGSPVRGAIADPLLRRLFMGIAMGLIAIGIISSPWGKQSGAHLGLQSTPVSCAKLHHDNEKRYILRRGSQLGRKADSHALRISDGAV